MAEPWFNEVAFGSWFGVIAGCVEGGMGAVLGTAASILVPRGKGRPWLLAGCALMSVVGLAALVFGLAALVSGQPYGIWYPPVLVGALGTILFGSGIPILRARYAVVERLRLEAGALRRT